MHIDPIQLQQQSKLMTDYRDNKAEVMKYFDYQPFQQKSYENRVQDLKERLFDREKLASVLASINQHWDAPDFTYKNIERLKDDNSVVVIGGQQAGLLTGPMYTINKIISIIQMARQQEEKLKIPVIPVFWIAGEDHDFEEINHIFLPKGAQLKKYKLQHEIVDKQSVSFVEKDTMQANQWLERVFKQLPETEYTKKIIGHAKDCLDQSDTYTDFFARIIFKLFGDTGIVLVDSAHPQLREIESEHFLSLIDKQPEISNGVYLNEQQLKQKGYSVSLNTKHEDAHLFYHYDGERILLTRNDTGDWVGKQDEVLLSTVELKDIAQNHPYKLSNNVVTRPLMQELVFPSLAFIGGPGEISYWSVLKPAFRAMNMNMPPVIPRLSFTIIDRNIEKLLMKHGLSTEYAVNHGVEAERLNWLASQHTPPIDKLADQIKHSIDEIHRPLRTVAEGMRADLGELAEKNLRYLYRDIDFLKEKLLKVQEEMFAKELNEFALIQASLRPNNGLQERMWNPLPWINRHGISFIQQLTEENCSFEHAHYLVYI